MSVTETELKNNLEKYLALSATEDILVTKNGRVIAKLTNPYQDRVQTAKSLFGILPADADVQQIQPYDTLYDMYYDEFEDADMDEIKERSSAKCIGIVEGKFTVPDEFDSWDKEVAEMFGGKI